jgi:hypothetical protein
MPLERQHTVVSCESHADHFADELRIDSYRSHGGQRVSLGVGEWRKDGGGLATRTGEGEGTERAAEGGCGEEG